MYGILYTNVVNITKQIREVQVDNSMAAMTMSIRL